VYGLTGELIANESLQQFITEVHRLADCWKFKEIKDKLIWDRLVVGILNQALSERLQMEADLTLDKAKWMIHQQEAVKTQQEALWGKEKAENFVTRQC